MKRTLPEIPTLAAQVGFGRCDLVIDLLCYHNPRKISTKFKRKEKLIRNEHLFKVIS